MITTVEQLNDQDLAQLASEIEALSREDDDQLFELTGNALYDIGLAPVEETTDGPLLQPVMYNPNIAKVNLSSIADYVMKTDPLTKTESIKSGKNFKERLRKAICSNKTIAAIFKSDTALKDNLKQIIPKVMGILGLAALSPLNLLIVCAVIALILKIGYDAYCGVKKEEEKQ